MAELLKLPLSADDQARVARSAARGGLVVFPTDTVYGVGTSALVPGAAERIYAAKGRDLGKPLPYLVASTEDARRWTRFGPLAEALAARFWPGPLTLVLQPTDAGRPLAAPGFGTLAVRVPAQDELRALIAASGVPWASTSANLSGEPAAADGAAAARALGSAVDWVIDGGPSGGVESTVADATGPVPLVLRVGALSPERILAAIR